MKKIVLIIILLLFLTGCDVKYDLVITNKEEIKEKIYVYIDNQIIENNSMSIDEYLDYYSNLYMDIDAYKDIEIDTKKGDNFSYFLVKKNYYNLDDYITSYTFKNMYNNATIERVGNYTSFTTSKNVYLDSIENDNLISEQSKYDSFEINIKFYNEVVNHNATKVDTKNNIYTWQINENMEEDFIYFKIGPKVRYDVMLKDIIANNLLPISVFGCIFLVIIILAIYMFTKIKKNNEID